MSKLFLILIVSLLFGCSAFQDKPYGVAAYSYSKEDGFKAVNGKEYSWIKATVKTDENGVKEVTYEAKDASAFEGQRIGAEITSQILAILPTLLQQAVSAGLAAQTGGLVKPGGVVPAVPATE